MIANRSVPTDTVLPHVVYQDVADAIAWLTMAFGFTEHYRHGEPGGPISGAQMHLGNAWIMVNGARAGRVSPAQLGCGMQSLTVFVEDLHETVYGERQYGAEDLDGHHWLFSRHARDVSPEEWGATVSEKEGARNLKGT